MGKPKVGFHWFASCGGCEESVVDLAEDVLTVTAAVDFVFFPVAMDFKKEDVAQMQDGEIDVCFINGAIRTSEEAENAELLRRKSKILIAYGSCSYQGGIPGLANLYEKDEILKYNYIDSPSTENPEGVFPQEECTVEQGTLTLPEFFEKVQTLDQTVDVDYYIPGCPPPVKLLLEAVTAVLEGKLPPKGTVLAPDVALCDECPRKSSKPEKMQLKEFKRPHEIMIDPEECLLAQGLLCLGPVTRCGCDSACVNGNMPCTGCLGPTSKVRDYGMKALSAVASVIDSDDEDEINAILDQIVDPKGTFYRYSLPSSMMYKSIPKREGVPA